LIGPNNVAFAEYVRVDNMPADASVSLTNMASALALFVGCNVDELGTRKK
jgi:hypothetical protein